MTQPTFSAYISGTEDATTDYPFPVNYFSIIKRDAVPSYYSIIATYSNELLDAFTSRPNGKLYLLRNVDAFDYCNIDSVPYYVGPRSSSISVTGSRQDTNVSPVGFTIQTSEATMTRQQANGDLTLILIPSLTIIRPADTVVYQGVNYVVKSASVQAGGSNNNRILTLEETP
jgi:hypothetical protein